MISNSGTVVLDTFPFEFLYLHVIFFEKSLSHFWCIVKNRRTTAKAILFFTQYILSHPIDFRGWRSLNGKVSPSNWRDI